MQLEEYIEKYSLGDEGREDLIKLFNASLIEIGNKILMEKCNEKKEKRFKSRKAEEYALEHGMSLEDFEMLEVSKKDVETKVRDNTRNKIVSTVSKKVKDRVICSGINKKGEACKAVGTIQPDGAKKLYCFRHSSDYRSFECDSDSSDSEEN